MKGGRRPGETHQCPGSDATDQRPQKAFLTETLKLAENLIADGYGKKLFENHCWRTWRSSEQGTRSFLRQSINEINDRALITAVAE